MILSHRTVVCEVCTARKSFKNLTAAWAVKHKHTKDGPPWRGQDLRAATVAKFRKRWNLNA